MNRRARQNKSSGRGRQQPMLNLIEQSERQLATRKDQCVCRGKTILQLSSAGLVSLAILPANLGSRVSSLSLLYSRWKVVKLVIEAITGNIDSNSFSSVGILDDVGTSSDLPTTQNDVLQLRCASLVYGNKTAPTIFQWNPIDSTKWYYTTTDTSDPRFVVPATIFASGSSGSYMQGQIHYTIIFEGAVAES